MNGESYRKEIVSLDAEIKRLAEHTNKLKLQRQNAKNHLYNYMVSHNLEQIGEGKNAITLAQCAPKKPRAKVKPKKERKRDALELFSNIGIPNPEAFYEQFESTQKARALSENGGDEIYGSGKIRRSKKKGRSDYDDFGF